MENNIVNATNEQIELLDKEASLSMRTKESLKLEFKAIEGKTDNDKLVSLLELHRKFQTTQDRFNIEGNIDTVEKALKTVTLTLSTIQEAVNQHERTMQQDYIVNVADEMKILKQQIESEEVLNARVINLEKELELLNKRYEEKEMMVASGKERIFELEADNKKYLSLNSELVSKENDYINQLREKDATINSKDADNSKLVNEYEKKIKALEDEYKAKMEQLEVDNKATVKDYENKLVEADKNKAVLENKISNLEANIVNIDKQNTELKVAMEQVRAEAKEDIKALEKEHRIEMKALEGNVKELEKANNVIELEKAKLEAKAENLEGSVNMLNEVKKSLEDEIKACNNSLKTVETEVATKEKEIEKINGSLSDATTELDKAKKNLDKTTKENKTLKEQIKKLEKEIN